jgi:pimeloyl-ACP methyl ester carboxylesterase
MQHPTLVLIHAFPLHGGMWEPQRHALDGAIDIYAPDLPGFGTAPGLDDQIFTMRLAARFVQRELESRGISRCIIAGLSMGGYIAFECWKLFPEMIAGLLLADTRATADTAEGRMGRFAGMDRISSGDFSGFAEDLLKKLVAPSTHESRPELMDAIRKTMHSSPPESAVSALLGLAGRADSTPLLPTINVPTALVFGAEDAITPLSDGQSMLSQIPGATLTEIPGAGHLSNLERPEEFNAALRELIERVGATVTA